jgi:hypothetical protein
LCCGRLGLTEMLIHAPKCVESPRHLIDDIRVGLWSPVDRVEILNFAPRYESHASNLFSPHER